MLLLVEKRLWTALVTLSEGSSKHWARQERAWPWTVGESSILRANSRSWIKNFCGRKVASSGSRHSSSLLSGCSSKAMTTSTENSRWTIYRQQKEKWALTAAGNEARLMWKAPLQQSFWPVVRPFPVVFSLWLCHFSGKKKVILEDIVSAGVAVVH